MALEAQTPEEITAALQPLLRAQLALYTEVRDLSKEQKKHIAAQNAELLLAVISEKQARIAKITALEAQAAPLKEQRDRGLESWPAVVRHELDPLIIELQAILAEIVTLEDESHSAAEALLETSSKQVQKIQKGKAMLNAYGKTAQKMGPARYQDKEG